MKTYIALLRGINVSGQKRLKMADLRTTLQKLPFESVETYIQSGNIVFKTVGASITQLQESIKKQIGITFGFDVPVVVKLAHDFRQILRDSPYTEAVDIEAKRIYYTFFNNRPSQDAILNLDQSDYPNELFEITPNCIYLNCTNGMGKAKLTNNIIEKKLDVQATTRNHRTMVKLMEMALS